MKVYADIRPSRIQPAVLLALYLLIAILCSLSPIPLWSIAVTLTLMLIVLLYQKFIAAKPARLLQLIQLERHSWCWYEGAPSTLHAQHTTRIEAELLQVQRAGPVIMLRFQTQPSPVRGQSWLIWRDQVDDDTWRRLCVLHRFWASRSTDI